MAVRLLLATSNRGKVAELRRILTRSGVGGVELLSADDVSYPEPDETGATFADNALIKARAASSATSMAALADDSGLVVDALGGEPGVHSARYAGVHGDDRANLHLVLERMAGVVDRRARFVCVAALVTPTGHEHTAEGILEGELTPAPRGTNGFGYDPIFQPLGSARTTAEMDPEDKDAISHRGRAFRAIATVVARYAEQASADTGGRAPARDQSLPPRSTS